MHNSASLQFIVSLKCVCLLCFFDNYKQNSSNFRLVVNASAFYPAAVARPVLVYNQVSMMFHLRVVFLMYTQKDCSLTQFREDIVRDLNNCSSNQIEFMCNGGQGWLGHGWGMGGGPVGDELGLKWGLFSLHLTYISNPHMDLPKKINLQKEKTEMTKIYIDCSLFHSVVEL